MRVRLRLVAVALSLALPALVLGRFALDSGTPAAVPTPAMPRQVGPWSSTLEQQLDPEVLAIIEPDAHLLRLYQAPQRSPIWVYIGLYAGRVGSGQGAHDPETCYPAQGWEIEGTRVVNLSVGENEEIRAHELLFRKGGAGEAVLYWFQPAERWPSSAMLEELLRVSDAVAGRPQYAFVRFSAPVTADAANDIAEFAVAIAPAIRRLVDDLSDAAPSTSLPTPD